MQTILSVTVYILCGITILSGQTQISENWDFWNSIPTSSSSALTVTSDYSTSSGIRTLFMPYRHLTNYSQPGGHHIIERNGLSDDNTVVTTGSYFGTMLRGDFSAARKTLLIK